MCVYDDFDGAYFSIQSIRLHHPEIINNIEFVIINNNPSSESGKALKNYVMNNITEPFQYLEFTKYNSTSLKNKIFDLADTPYVLCMDCHVLLEPQSLMRLVSYYDTGRDEGNLLQGPLLYDDLKSVSTHFNREWGSQMLGKWDLDTRYKDKNTEPFEIPSQGMGLFSCRKDSWLGYNKNFRGFGGEECYIHDKYRAAGRKTMCLPFLRWNHRFTRVNGVPYPNTFDDRYRNYIIGFTELGKDIGEVEENFKSVLSADKRDEIKAEVRELFKVPVYSPPIEIKVPVTDTSGRAITSYKGCGCGKG